MNLNYASDRRLDILVLGPMTEGEVKAASCNSLQQAIEALLREPDIDVALTQRAIAPQDRVVHVPEEMRGQNIFDNVLSHLDIADLVVFNFTPKEEREEASANVFYELGLVHALGIPALYVVLKRNTDGSPIKIPFYAREMLQHRVDDFEPETLKNALRPTIQDFIVKKNPANNYHNNRITLFYRLPIVDISAVYGLATGYYYNFLQRLIDNRSFRGSHPQDIRRVVVVIPSSVTGYYSTDIKILASQLHDAGLDFKTGKAGKQLPAPPNDPLGPVWFDHIQDIVVDIPRTIYPLQMAPRLRSYKERHTELNTHQANQQYEQRLRQFDQQFLAKFIEAIRYQMRLDGIRVSSGIVSFVPLEEAAGEIQRLLKAG